MAKKVTKYLGRVRWKIYSQKLEKNAQYCQIMWFLKLLLNHEPESTALLTCYFFK